MGLDIYVDKFLKQPIDENTRFFKLTNKKGEWVENNFPEWTNDFISNKTISFYDFEKYKEQTGIDVNDYCWVGEEYGSEGNFLFLWPKEYEYPNVSNFVLPDKDEKGNVQHDWEAYDAYKKAHTLAINFNDVPLKEVETKIIYTTEVGYQRKGLNKKFYDDYDEGKIFYYVWEKKELERYKQDYCTTDDDKENFQRNIIDEFIDGETVARFSW